MTLIKMNVPRIKWQTYKKVFPWLNSGKKYIMKAAIALHISVLPINKSRGPISRKVKKRSPNPTAELKRDQHFFDVFGQSIVDEHGQVLATARNRVEATQDPTMHAGTILFHFE